MTSFINPYHFVPFPQQSEVEKQSVSKEVVEQVLEQGSSSSESQEHDAARLRHDHYAPQMLSGRLICKLTTESPCVFGNVHETDKTWSARVKNYEIDGKPAIAATQLRGLIGSLYEIVTCSSMRVLVNQGMSLRSTMHQARMPIGMIYEREGKRFLLPRKSRAGPRIPRLPGDFRHRRGPGDRRELVQRQIRIPVPGHKDVNHIQLAAQDRFGPVGGGRQRNVLSVDGHAERPRCSRTTACSNGAQPYDEEEECNNAFTSPEFHTADAIRPARRRTSSWPGRTRFRPRVDSARQ